MKKTKILKFLILGISIASCNGTKKDESNFFSFDESKFKSEFHSSDTIKLCVLNTEKKKIDSIQYFVNDVKVSKPASNDFALFSFSNQKLGYQNLKAFVYFEDQKQEVTSRVELVSHIQPKLLTYEIVNTYPHDIKSFTEGLEFYKDTLYESTGQNGSSYFRKYDYKSGKVFKEVSLDSQYFGEGITILKDKIYQLTWQSNVGFVYNVNTLKEEKKFNYDKPIEGWGMTNDGVNLYQSDGTEKIWKMNPETLKMIDNINVYAGSSKIKSINELEFIEGKIYGNIWQKDAIAVINPENGVVEGVLNLAELRKLVKNQEAEVLNGIAFNSKTKTIFVTGKNWEKMFEIKIK